MATLTIHPIAPSPGAAAQQEQRSEKSAGGDGADLGDIDSGTRISFRRIWLLLPLSLLRRSLPGRHGFLEVWCTQLFHSTRESGMWKVRQWGSWRTLQRSWSTWLRSLRSWPQIWLINFLRMDLCKDYQTRLNTLLR